MHNNIAVALYLQVQLSSGCAHEFRTKGVALARAKTDGFAGDYFGLCNTLATKVCYEVRLQFKSL